MSTSVFERTRALHADIEQLKDKLLQRLTITPQASADRVLLDHELKNEIDELVQCQAKLLELYQDKDGVRASELRQMSGETMWSSFYDALSSLRAYHAKFPQAAQVAALEKEKARSSTKDADATTADAMEAAARLTAHQDALSKLPFSDEEAFGTRVDMHALHERHINLPQFSRSTDYLTFLATFADFSHIPRTKKIRANRDQYRKYLQSVLDYLTDYYARVEPLVGVETLMQMVKDEFEQKWEAKEIPGWFDDEASTANGNGKDEQPGAATAAAQPASSTDAAAQPASSSSSDGAAADSNNPLYCKACSKLFAKDTVFNAHLQGKKHKRNAQIAQALTQPAAMNGTSTLAATSTSASSSVPQNGTAPSTTAVPSSSTLSDPVAKLSADIHHLAFLEFSISAFHDLLRSHIDATRDYLIKKQTRTFEEIEMEKEKEREEIRRAQAVLRGEKIEGEGGEEEEEEKESDPHAPIYNPLNLPLGFDGKPIPYWLYKLHGLNLKFSCQICGDYTYSGPRNFERHFTEWRHAYGMRALGIPNTKHFMHITKIEDALALFERLKKEGAGAGWKAEEEEEFEDAEGNVFNKKTYLELQKQGLV